MEEEEEEAWQGLAPHLRVATFCCPQRQMIAPLCCRGMPALARIVKNCNSRCRGTRYGMHAHSECDRRAVWIVVGDRCR
jgi:hypothetical protein